TVAVGQTSATFTVTTNSVTAQKQVTVTATSSGVSQSATLTINPATPPPATTYSLTASPTSVVAGTPLTVSWTAPAGRPTTDWVGLFKADGSNTRVWWQYTGGTPSGSYTLAAPQDTGQYEFRYSLENGNAVAATSGIVTVTALTIT